MQQYYKDPGNAEVGDILAFINAALQDGDDAVVPASCLPVMTLHAGCQPEADGAAPGSFVFRASVPSRVRCGIGERFAALLLLLALSPVFLAVAAMIFLVDGAPVLFFQERYGYEGRPFTLIKFRTMVRRSERLHERLQRRLGKKGRLFKLVTDPRLTRSGGFLRRMFLDELPQLINVVRGEMRFVGPRPLPASDRGHYTQPCHALRLKGVPGMTGLWQVAGRNERTFDEMCLLDTYYLCNRSAALDARILGRTVRLMFKQIGLKREAQDRGQ